MVRTLKDVSKRKEELSDEVSLLRDRVKDQNKEITELGRPVRWQET